MARKIVFMHEIHGLRKDGEPYVASLDIVCFDSIRTAKRRALGRAKRVVNRGYCFEYSTVNVFEFDGETITLHQYSARLESWRIVAANHVDQVAVRRMSASRGLG